MTKPIHYCSITLVMLLFIFAAKLSSAQNFNYMAATNRALSVNFMQFQMQSMMNNMRFANGNWNYTDNVSTNGKLVFEVVTNKSRFIEIKSKIFMDTVKRKTYILFKDVSLRDNDSLRVLKLYPSDVKSIKITRGDDEKMFQPQLTTDSCWMFKVVQGEISVYSNGIAIVALQKHDGPLTSFDMSALKAMLETDDKARKYFDQQQYVKAIEKYNKNYAKAQ